MKTIEQIDAEIAALQAEREAARGPDLGEALDVFRAGKAELIAARKAEQRWEPANEVADPTMDQIELYGLIAAYPALHKVLGPRAPEPTEADDLAMAREVYRPFDYLGHVTDVIVAAFKAERKRAGGGK
jgi:hypothetical protein